MILNIKILPFIDLSEIDDRFLNIYNSFEGEGDKFKVFLDYFHKNFIKSAKYSKTMWNYQRGVVFFFKYKLKKLKFYKG